ncbi:MAG: PilZ domain-containing protein [Candidatus Omnitrophota bacterium]
MNENRKAVRWNIILPVRYVGLSRHTESSAMTRDLSLFGAKLAMVERHRPGDKLEMMLDMPAGDKNNSMRVDADVVWQKPACDFEEGCNYMTGVVFRNVRDCHKQSLVEYVSLNHPQEFRQHWWDGV